MSKEAIDKAIEMRQQVIDGGELYRINNGKWEKYNGIIDDMTILIEIAMVNGNYYKVIMPAKKKRVPLTKEDLDARFMAGKTMRIVCNDGILATIGNWIDDTIVLEYISGSYATMCSSEIMQDKFVDGDPCYKEVEK